MTGSQARPILVLAPLLAAATTTLPLPAAASEMQPAEIAASAPEHRAGNETAAVSADGTATATTDPLAATRNAVRGATLWPARTVDGWFGDGSRDSPVEVRDGRLSLDLMARQGEDFDARLRFSARMRLPNAERHATYLFLGRDDPRDVVKDRPDEVSSQQLLLRQETTDPSFFAGLGLTLHDRVDFRIGFRGGLNPYAQARYRHAWLLGDADRIDFRQTFFLSVDERFGSTSTLSYSHAFSRVLTGRWFNSATISQDSRVFEWSSIVGAYRSYGRQRQSALELVFNGEQNSGIPVSEYGLQAKWEQPVHEDWLLMEFIVGHFWPRDTPQGDRGRAWAVGGGLRLLF